MHTRPLKSSQTPPSHKLPKFDFEIDPSSSYNLSNTIPAHLLISPSPTDRLASEKTSEESNDSGSGAEDFEVVEKGGGEGRNGTNGWWGQSH
jgi:hypothetical protein